MSVVVMPATDYELPADALVSQREVLFSGKYNLLAYINGWS
jgi:hypothetical protein